MKQQNFQFGFTLLEMVVAISIFAVMGVIAFSGIGQMTRTGQAVADSNSRLADLQFAVVYFNRDWTQVSPRRIRDQYGDEAHNIVIGDDTITFTRSGWDNFLNQPRSSLQRVQYALDDNKLVRRHWRSLDQGIGEQPVQVVLLDRVENMEVNFRNALDQPIRTWPTEIGPSDGAPILLSLRLEVADIGEINRLLEVPDGAL